MISQLYVLSKLARLKYRLITYGLLLFATSVILCAGAFACNGLVPRTHGARSSHRCKHSQKPSSHVATIPGAVRSSRCK